MASSVWDTDQVRNWNWEERGGEPSSWEAAGWSEQGQMARFECVRNHLQLSKGESVLDYGCGTGAFSSFVRGDCRYFGVDSSAGMYRRATIDQPFMRFKLIHGHPIEVLMLPCFTGPIDHVVAIGVWNLPQDTTPWLHLEQFLKIARKSVILSLHRDKYNLVRISVMLDHFGLTNTIIDGTHLDNDYVVVIRK